MNRDNLDAILKLAAAGTPVDLVVGGVAELEQVMSYLEDQGFKADVANRGSGYVVRLC
ncbi:MAG: hypothetical protein P3T54_00070 [Dehalogenimonas sp.]|nr:hypothetical protein [Dehalogenimonas sp.]